MIWTEVVIRTHESMADELSELIRPFGQNSSVVIEQLGDPDDLDPAALLPEVYLKIYLSEIVDSPMLRQELTEIATQQGMGEPTFRRIEESEWAEAWKVHYQPFQIGRSFWIYPQWEPLPDDSVAGNHVIRLDPGLAFGTGQHETTQLCLEAIETLIKPGMGLLDLGTGSGILAIGAAFLGANPIVAIDNDPVAVRSAGENAALNDMADRIEFALGSAAAAPDRHYDVIMVNILAAVIMSMIEEEGLLELGGPKTTFVFSGVIVQQQEQFLTFLQDHNVQVLTVRQKNDWLAIEGRVS